VQAVGEPAFEDLTARARIRGAAIAMIAERGAEAATIRAIAAAAGVSGGLVRHHFGSKDDLRAACDAHALAQLMRFKEQAVLEGGAADAGFLSASQPGILHLLRYVARSILDGSPAAEAMYGALVATAERWVSDHHPGQTADLTAFAALLVATEMGTLVLHDQLSRSLGADVLTPEGHLRLVRAKVELYSKPLLDPELAAGALAAIDRLRQAMGVAGGPLPDGPG
jgi:AcrR family transcriptional regulator